MLDSVTHRFQKQTFQAKPNELIGQKIETMREQQQAIHTSMLVTGATIAFSPDKQIEIGGKNQLYNFVIDGIPLHTVQSPMKIAEI